MTRDSNLREQAERLLSKKGKGSKKIPTQYLESVIQELEVHQIELEMQNEELRKAQMEIEESRTMFSNLYDFAPIGYFTFDQQGVIKGVNLTGAKFLDVQRSLLLNKPFNVFIDPDFRDDFHIHCKKVFSTGAKQTCELKLLKKDEPSFHVSLESIALKDKEGNDAECLSAASDITDRKRAEELLVKMAIDLARSNTDLKAFAHVASHDLKEPLRTITGFLGLLEKRYKDKFDEKGIEWITFAVDGARRMAALIRDLLEDSQIGANEKVFKPTGCDLTLSKAILNLHAVMEESKAKVTHDSLPTVLADSALLTSLFQNLIENAIKYRGSEAPRVHLSAERKDNEWVFSVRDNGIGIDPQFHEQIFAAFRRLHARDEYSGTGIGLATCKKIVDYHGGKIWVESEPRKGATFYFTIPDRRPNT